ncbi:MAG: amino acid adenylation domain-containing protein [Burkholderiaceae bacterium]
MSLAQRLAKLSPERRRLLERLASGRLHDGVHREAPASFEQERLWFLQQLEPDDVSYHLHMHVVLPEQLDVTTWRAAWRWLVERHEVLRTRFIERQGQPWQVIDPPGPVAVAEHDLRALDPDERRQAAAWIAREQAETPFDLARGPLLRVALLRMPQHPVQVLTLHHIIADGWSIELLMRELDTACASLAGGLPIPLPPLPMQFGDFARRERERLDAGRVDELLAFWQHYLDGAPALRLPTDRHRPDVFSHRAGVRARLLAPALRARLDALARSEGVTPFQALLAAYAVLLHRCTGQRDLVFGTPVSHRDTPEVEGLIGFFLNTVLLRVRLAPEQSFREVLAATRQSTIDAYGARQLPFARLVQHLQPERSLRRNPLYQATVQFLRARQRGSRTRAVLDEIGYEMTRTNVDLALDLFESDEGLLCRFEYSSDLFDDGSVERLLTQWERVLERVCAGPDAAIATLPLTDAGESRLLLGDWAGQLIEPPQPWGFGPSGPPVRVHGERGTLERAELDALCGRLATVLRTAGAGEGDVVALLLSDPLETLIAVLAAWRAGAAYAHFDPDAPAARISAQIDALAPALVLDDAGAWRQAMLASEPLAAPTGIPAGRLAAVFHTSGTTGRPKAVPITHGGLALQWRWLREQVAISPNDVVLQKYGFGFDAALCEVLAGLACGAALVVAPDHGRDLERLVSSIRRHAVSVLDLVPAQLAALLEQPGFAACHTLRRVICGGEALSAELAGSLLRVLPGVQLINAYGPTEASITACSWLRPDDADPLADPPIGRPLPGTLAYVLDPALQPVPVGLQGQLFLGGAALADGYLGDPVLTAQRFIANPHGPGLLYATGDRVCWQADGQLRYLGRLDRQLKLRGVRIEPEEIERVLATHPAVQQAAVTTLPLPAVPPAAAATMAWRLQQLSPPEADFLYRFETDHDRSRSRIMWRNTPDFDVYLDIRTPAFLDTPRPEQRNWLLRRTLDETVDDLQSLQDLARRCIAGGERPAMAGDWPQREARYSADELLIAGQQVMQAWEAPLMEALADAVAKAGADVVEIGFGMGLSAGFIQARQPRSHTIVECHPDVLEALETWRGVLPVRSGAPDSRQISPQAPQRDSRRKASDVRVVASRWQDWQFEPASFDGVLFDTYPTSEEEYARNVTRSPTFAADFFPTAAALLRPGGVFTYYTNEIDSLSRRHQRLLFEHFSSFSVRIVRHLQPPPDCQYWWADSMAVVAAVR